MAHATFVSTEVREERPAKPLTRYEDDAHAWAMEQAGLLKAGRFADLDLENLADEVEDVARRERRELESRLSLVFHHLMKWDFQPERRGPSWIRTIKEQRRQVNSLLEESPSLAKNLASLFQEGFKQGRVAALNETGLAEEAMPTLNPYSWEDLMTRPIDGSEP